MALRAHSRKWKSGFPHQVIRTGVVLVVHQDLQQVFASSSEHELLVPVGELPGVRGCAGALVLGAEVDDAVGVHLAEGLSVVSQLGADGSDDKAGRRLGCH